MKRTLFIFAVAAALSACFFGNSALGCTGITIRAADGSVVHARSLEWGGPDLHSKAVVIPRGTPYLGLAYSGKRTKANAGKTWTSRHGVVGMSMLYDDLVLDGMNEKGLACGSFYLPGFTQFQSVGLENRAKAICAGDFNIWVLTQFSSVDEVVGSLGEIVVGPAIPDAWKGDMSLHWIVTDARRSVVIESIGGKLVVFESPLGVITNAPNYDWHMLNLRNWVNLRAEGVKTAQLARLQLAPFGAGSGLHGLPGDITPPSRFVRAALFSQTALEPKDADEAVRTSIRVMSAFFITQGYARDKVEGEMQYDHTQWEAFADLSGGRYFFLTYDNPNVRMIDLKRTDMRPGPIKVVAERAFVPIDVTAEAKVPVSSN